MSDSVRPHRRQPSRLPSLGFSRENFLLQCMKVKSKSEVAQLCPTLHNPMDCSPPGSSIHGISQARVLEWVTIAFSFRRSRAALIQNSFTELCLLWSCGFLCLDGCPVSFLYMPSKACCCKHPETPVGATG